MRGAIWREGVLVQGADALESSRRGPVRLGTMSARLHMRTYSLKLRSRQAVAYAQKTVFRLVDGLECSV